MKSRTPLTFLALSAALLSACSSSTLSSLPLANGNVPYYIHRGKAVTVDADYVDRYACTGSLLVCTSTGRVANSVSCRCP